MLDVGGSFRGGAEAAGRIRRWVEEILPAEETATLLVTELTCSEPGCCDVSPQPSRFPGEQS